MSSTSVLARSALAAAILLLAVGCGDDDPDTAADPSGETPSSQSPSGTDQPTSDLPACADVWVTGATLPRSYRGCDQEGTTVKADKHTCSYGAAIVEFDDKYYAITGKTINEVPSLADSDQFRRALSACQG